MQDLISRQAAINAINQICPIDTEYDCTLLDRVDVRCVLTDLPSAQPERMRGEVDRAQSSDLIKKIEPRHCKDCSKFDDCRISQGAEFWCKYAEENG